MAMYAAALAVEDAIQGACAPWSATPLTRTGCLALPSPGCCKEEHPGLLPGTGCFVTFTSAACLPTDWPGFEKDANRTSTLKGTLFVKCLTCLGVDLAPLAGLVRIQRDPAVVPSAGEVAGAVLQFAQKQADHLCLAPGSFQAQHSICQAACPQPTHSAGRTSLAHSDPLPPHTAAPGHPALPKGHTTRSVRCASKQAMTSIKSVRP